MPVTPIPCGPDGGTGTPGDCACAPSIATAPLCRADGTTVLVVVRSPCGTCGTPAADPVQVGWIDPVTGVFTPGAPPADAGPCETTAPPCVETVCRQRCDDTTGDGTADTTYSELWCLAADGTATLLLTYQDDPSTPYAPVSPVECTYGCPDHETVMLCDESGPFLRRYTFLAGAASFEDVALDGQTPHIVTGTPGACAGQGDPPCEAQTTPAATLGLCLPGGMPIAVVVTRDCATGTVTQDGWINLTTGLYSAGPPPAGAQACGDSRAFELGGLLCDVLADGTVAGVVLVEYEYNPDGSLATVRLVNPADGSTYTLQGELTVCPGGSGGPVTDPDLTVLCDVQADGTATAFLRDYRRDPASGQITGHTDYRLDGTAYVTTGTVGVCPAEDTTPEPCRNSTTLLLCDLPQDGQPTPTVTDTGPAPYYPYATGTAVAGAQGLWDGGTLNLPDAAGPQPGTTGTVRTAAAVIQAPRPACDAGTAHVTVQVDVTQLGPDNGCAATGFLGLYNGTGEANRVALALAPANTPAGWSGTLTAEADVPAADLAAGNITVLVAFDAYDDSGSVCPPPRRTGWQLSQFDATVVYDQTGCAQQFLRTVTVDCTTGAVVEITDTTLDGAPYDVTGAPGQCTLASSGGAACCPADPCPAHSVIEQCRCDDTDGDGLPDVGYVELLAVDCTGALTSLGTYTADMAAAYTPVAPVDCDAVDPAEGSPPAFGVQARRVQLEAGESWSAADWPVLQSVTVVAHGGTGTITTADGPSTLHIGESASWSVARDTDALLTGPLVITADTGTVTLNITTGVTL